MMKLGEIRRYRRQKGPGKNFSLLPRTIYAAKILSGKMQIQRHKGETATGTAGEYLLIESLSKHAYFIAGQDIMDNYYVDQNVYAEDAV